jgi:transketolase
MSEQTPQMENVFFEESEEEATGPGPRGAAVIAEELARLAVERDDIVVLSADMGAVMTPLKERRPDRYVELGIAETNTVSVAAGLAASGFVPFIVSMGPFGAIKCAEQIRTDLAYNELPVRFVARLSGLAMGFFGPSHHAVEDLAIARSITNLTVVAPASDNAILGLLRSTMAHRGPVFFRISEGLEQEIYPEPPSFERGRFVELRQGGDLTIIGTGVGVHLGLAAAELLAAEGLHATVLDAAYLKPFDDEAVLRAARETGAILTVEEHNVTGGLGSAVAEVLGRNAVPARLKIHALPDEELVVGVPAALQAWYGLTPETIAAEARQLAGERRPVG